MPSEKKRRKFVLRNSANLIASGVSIHPLCCDVTHDGGKQVKRAKCTDNPRLPHSLFKMATVWEEKLGPQRCTQENEVVEVNCIANEAPFHTQMARQSLYSWSATVDFYFSIMIIRTLLHDMCNIEKKIFSSDSNVVHENKCNSETPRSSKVHITRNPGLQYSARTGGQKRTNARPDTNIQKISQMRFWLVCIVEGWTNGRN